jgi:hypothetical protein
LPRYLLLCGDQSRGSYESLRDALAAAEQCRGETIRILRCETVLSLTPEGYRALREAGTAAPTAFSPPPAEAGRAGGAAGGEKLGSAEAAVVFDQMFKRFAEILDRELPDKPLVFHEIIGRGLERPLRVGDRLYQQPARDDYDVLKLLEELAKRHRLVVFFTGDRRLAGQARAVPRVRVVYLPPGEVSGKEMAIKLMKKEILRSLEETGIGQ